MPLRNLIGAGVILSVFFLGCQNTLSPGSPEDNGAEQKATGVKLENPYTVESMLRARDSLIVKGVLNDRQIGDELFQATHYYVRFKPETKEEYNRLLTDRSIAVWNYPLDYAFPEGMNGYRDQEIPDGKPDYLYSTIPVEVRSRYQNYEILAELILAPDAGEAALAKQSELLNYYDYLEGEALRITGNAPIPSNEAGKPLGTWRPSGSILVYDDVLGRNVPVVGVNIRVRNWFKWWDGATDYSGNFKCPKDYYGDVAYSLKWEYADERFDIRTGSTGQAFYNGPNQSSGAWNLVISSGMSWVYAHVYRAGSYYICQEPYGLSDPPFNLISVCVYDKNASADEAGHYNTVNENIIMYKNNSSGVKYSAKELFSIAAHEFGHAHHDHIYKGGSVYADFNKRLMESWAVGVSYYLTADHYSTPLNSSSDFWYTKQNFARTSGSNYTPLIIDLIDNFNQRTINSGYLTDFISGYTLQQMQSILAESDSKTFNGFKNALKALPLPCGVTNTTLDDYLKQYDGIAPPAYNETRVAGTYVLAVNSALFSPNNRFFLLFQTDGNLVLYDSFGGTYRDVWTSRSWGRTATLCLMQTDGNLVIYNGSLNVWCSGTWGNPNAILAVTDNGRVVIYNSARTTELWSSTNDTSLLF